MKNLVSVTMGILVVSGLAFAAGKKDKAETKPATTTTAPAATATATPTPHK